MKALKGLCCVAALLVLAGTAMAAGNVEVFAKKGNLGIVGDSASNELWIENSGTTFTVYAYSGTTINGQSSATFSNITGDLLIDMRDGGNNYVYLSYVHVDDDLVVLMGKGNDVLDIYGTNVHDDAKVVMGDGNNYVYMNYSYVGDKATVKALHGSDHVYLYSSGSECKMLINTGKGNDGVQVRYGTFDKLAVKAGKGNDWVALGNSYMDSLCYLNGSKGYDTLYDYGGNSAGKMKEKGFESGS